MYVGGGKGAGKVSVATPPASYHHVLASVIHNTTETY